MSISYQLSFMRPSTITFFDFIRQFEASAEGHQIILSETDNASRGKSGVIRHSVQRHVPEDRLDSIISSWYEIDPEPFPFYGTQKLIANTRCTFKALNTGNWDEQRRVHLETLNWIFAKTEGDVLFAFDWHLILAARVNRQVYLNSSKYASEYYFDGSTVYGHIKVPYQLREYQIPHE